MQLMQKTWRFVLKVRRDFVAGKTNKLTIAFGLGRGLHCGKLCWG